MIRLSTQDTKEVKSLARKLCCNYYEGNCLLLDNGEQHECPQCCARSVVCKWFRDAVLPQNNNLSTRLTMPPKTKACENCSRIFVYKSKKAQYCPDCKKKIARIRATQRKRKQRSKQK